MAGKWYTTRQRTHEQKGRVQVDAHAQFGLVGAAAMHDLNVIQGPNVT